MITLSLLIAACFTLVSPQLAPAQHTALMELYDALGVATVTEKENKEQKIIFLFSVFSFTVPALCGDCTVLWQRSEMFWEQRDCCVRMEVCLCCGLMYRDSQVLVRLSTDRHYPEHCGPAVVAYGTVSWNRRRWVMCLRWSEHRLLFSSILQGLERQSTDRHDSEHRGPAVVASVPVSWNRRQR